MNLLNRAGWRDVPDGWHCAESGAWIRYQGGAPVAYVTRLQPNVWRWYTDPADPSYALTAALAMEAADLHITGSEHDPDHS